jgi:DNA-binding transcriptional regulator LsrR (DeoR family)
MEDRLTRKDLIKVAKLYYLGNLSQAQIAQSMGVSRPKVSRMLTQARAQNIIEFKIKDFPMMTEEMSEKIRSYFDLIKVIVVPSAITPEQSKNNAGKEASAYLNSILRNDLQIGLSWGTTLQSMIRMFELKKRVSNISVIQLAGGVHTRNIGLDSQKMVCTFAEKLDATYSLLQAPLVVTSPTVRNLLINEPEVRNHFARFEDLDIALIGVGSMSPEEAIPYKAGYITLEQSHLLANTGFATDICGNRIYLDGTIRQNLLTDRLISISPEQIRKVPLVISLAVGAEKAIPVIAAAKGRFVHVLIIDEIAALTIMDMENIS